MCDTIEISIFSDDDGYECASALAVMSMDKEK